MIRSLVKTWLTAFGLGFFVFVALSSPSFAQQHEILVVPEGFEDLFGFEKKPEAKPSQPPLLDCFVDPNNLEACAKAKQQLSQGSGLQLESTLSSDGNNSEQGSPVLERVLIDLNDDGSLSTAAAKPKKSSPSSSNDNYSIPKDDDSYDNKPASHSLTSIDISIGFDFNKASIRGTEIYKIDQIAGVLTAPAAADLRFAIIGHTDAKGSTNYNCDLSRARADSVATALSQRGVTNWQISAFGAGEFVLKDRKNPHSGINRRVGFIPIQNQNRQILDALTSVCY